MSRSMSQSYKVIGRSGRPAILLALIVLVLLFGLWHMRWSVRAAAGDLDPTFGTGGKVVTSFPGGLDSANDVAVQADGKIVVAGTSGSDFALTRYNTNGNLDTTFGVGGRVHTDFPFGRGGFARALVIQPDGKIVLGGSATDPANSFNSVFALVRYNADGTLDTTFNTDGRVVTPFPNSSAQINDLVLQPDGKIVAAGQSTNNTTFAGLYALARYNPDGSLDTSFDGDGRVTTDFPGFTFEEARAVAIQTDGKIVAAGLGNSTFTLARYNSTGALDTTSFGTGGLVTTDFGESFEQANALAIQTDGKIIAVGEAATSVAANMNFALARYNPDGSLDNTFDTDGKVITDFGFVDAANDVLIQTDGKIVAAGRAGTIAAGSFFALARYEINGSLDNTFDTDGRVTTDFSGGRFGLGALGVALQADGRIVAAGDANITGQRDFGVARYTTTGALDNTFHTDGKVQTDFALNEDAITALLVQPDAKIIAVGLNNLVVRLGQAQDPNFQLARYNTTGALDPTFGTGGIVQTDFAAHGDDFANGAVLQSDGKIVVVGQTGAHFSQSPTADTSFGIARYNANGTLDNTFSGDGRAVVDFGPTHDAAVAVAVQPNGKIVVAGTNGSDFALVRLNANGSLDNTFDGDGKLTTDLSGVQDAANAIVIQTDGKIVAAGAASNGELFGLARYTATGALDNTFDGDGLVTTDFLSGKSDIIRDLVIQPDGKLLAAGIGNSNSTSSGQDFALARYNTDGSLDTSFGTGGKVTTDFGAADGAEAVALQADGKIVAAGFYDNFLSSPPNGTASSYFAVARYNTNGQLDSSFGAGGKVTTDFFGIDNGAAAVAIQSDGKIVAGGNTETGSSRDFALARYQTTVAPPPTPTPTPTPASTTVQFRQASYTLREDCTALPVTVIRTGNTSGTTTVNYQTTDGTASQKMDYNLALGRLTFAPGETQKIINLLINEDSKVEGTEQFTISLSNPSGASLGARSTATINIADDATETTGNALDQTPVFVCQHYHDFLNRQPDPVGFTGWQNTLNNCQPGDTRCDRIEVSSAFFRSDEFQIRGYFLYRFYSVAFGRHPRYQEFMMDLSHTTGFLTDQQIEAEKLAFINEFMSRQEFKNRYDSQTNPAAYVNLLVQTAGVTLSNKQALIDDLAQGRKTRAEVLRAIVESPEVTQKFYKEAFVVMQYFGYLRRDPDILYLNWIQTFNQNNDYRHLVNGFLNSAEYRQRFGP